MLKAGMPRKLTKYKPDKPSKPNTKSKAKPKGKIKTKRKLPQLYKRGGRLKRTT
jgi:hypothetical protein